MEIEKSTLDKIGKLWYNSYSEREVIEMKKIFKNAYELSTYFIKENRDTRQWGFLSEYYYNSPIQYLLCDMYDKYIRGKSILAKECQEFKEAEQNAIAYLETKLIQNGYNLSILYTNEVTYADGYSTCFKIKIETIPQQLELEL